MPKREGRRRRALVQPGHVWSREEVLVWLLKRAADQGVGIEDLELLLDADREVGRRGEMRTCLLERVERISFDGLAHGRAGR